MPTTLIGFSAWLLSDSRRAVWGLVYFIVGLGAVVIVTALLAPYLGPTAGALIGAGTGAGGSGIAIVAGRRRKARRHAASTVHEGTWRSNAEWAPYLLPWPRSAPRVRPKTAMSTTFRSSKRHSCGPLNPSDLRFLAERCWRDRSAR